MTGAKIPLLECHAREKLQQPDTWHAYAFECLVSHPRHASRVQVDAYKITGGVAPLKTRGPNAGRPNWRKADRRTVCVAYLTPAEHAAWVTAWAARTGRCLACLGQRQVSTGWRQDAGTQYTPCPQCVTQKEPA